jgi:hypothetical protein
MVTVLMVMLGNGAGNSNGQKRSGFIHIPRQHGTATMVNFAQQAYLFYGIGWLAREFFMDWAGWIADFAGKTLRKVARQSVSMV